MPEKKKSSARERPNKATRFSSARTNCQKLLPYTFRKNFSHIHFRKKKYYFQKKRLQYQFLRIHMPEKVGARKRPNNNNWPPMQLYLPANPATVKILHRKKIPRLVCLEGIIENPLKPLDTIIV